ncbi:MAG: type IV toxin-antitoxin system AbiEi family antitoxin domain-containing protein [Knoellia sp.]
MTSLEPLLLTLAAGQDGMITTAQAQRAGMDKSSLARAVVDGVLLHPMRSLYAVAEVVDATSPIRWHRHLAQGARLIYPDLMFASVTAVFAHDIAVWGCDLSKPQVLRPISRSTGVRGLRVRPMRGKPVDTPWGPAAMPADALVQLAMDYGTEQGIVSADHALRSGIVTTEALSSAVAAVAQWPDAHKARSLAALTCGLRESVGESRCGIALELAGIPVTPQVEIRDSFGNFVARVDFLVDGENVIVEFDGKVKFEAGDPEVLWAEKKREDRLRRLGYVVVRIIWADLEKPGAVAAKVRSAIRNAA